MRAAPAKEIQRRPSTWALDVAHLLGFIGGDDPHEAVREGESDWHRVNSPVCAERREDCEVALLEEARGVVGSVGIHSPQSIAAPLSAARRKGWIAASGSGILGGDYAA